MSPLQGLWNLVRRRRLDEDLRQEVETHLALIEDEERARGQSAIKAHHTARTRFGNPLVYRERAFDAVTWTWLVDAWKDVTLAARRLVRSPTFSGAAVVTLALAIGANASIFALVKRVVLDALPYPDSDRLIEVDHGAQRLNVMSGLGITPGLYYHYAERARTLEGVALYRTDDMTLFGDGEPERIRVSHATPVAGVGPASRAGRRSLVFRKRRSTRFVADGRLIARAVDAAVWWRPSRHREARDAGEYVH